MKRSNSYKIDRDDFVKFRPEMAEERHQWEFMMPFRGADGLMFRQEAFKPEDYDTPEDCYEAMCDMVRGCQMAGMDYYVFCDDKLVTGF